ncbi:MAG: hypothetical protein M1835_001169 [Candelina submexicana]|nr:MAG: hypothetical protein M1835_001169 [Candelina submexicana]
MASVVRAIEEGERDANPSDVVDMPSHKDPSGNQHVASHRAHNTASRHSEESSDLKVTNIDVEKAVVGPSPSSSNTVIDGTEQPTRDPNIVDWDGLNDAANPLNWSNGLKWGNIAVISAITFITPLASSMFAPGIPQVMSEFYSSNDLLAGFVVSVYVLGYAFGPLLIAPLSELYGRLVIYHSCNALFVIFTIACAVSSNLNMLIAFRFFEGCAGSAPLTIGGGTIADMIVQEKRGGAMAVWAMGPLMGPVVGPVAGGFLSQAKGWRWVFWVIAIVAGAISLMAVFLLRETNASTLLALKTKRLRKLTQNQDLRSKMDTGIGPRQLFLTSIIRPSKMLLFSPIVLSLSLYMAIVYGYLYLLFTTFTLVYEDRYGFSSGTVGLTYLGIGVGMFVGLAFVGVLSDKIVQSKSKNGVMKPEYRLPPMIPGALCIPIGLFWYGWSAESHTHWIIPILGTLLIGAGVLVVFMAIQTYLVDAFTLHAASAIAANTVLRSTCGALLPLAGQKMYAKLGLGWGNSLLAFVALALCPMPWIFLRYGERIRTNPRFRVRW